jgi:hypothetical protein
MLSGVLGFPLQPVDGHTLITSWSLSLEPILFLSSDEMSGRHLLHNTPKLQSIGVYTINQLTGLWICVLDSEKLFGMKRLPVDGFCKDTITVYEFQGCIWHGHRCWMIKKYNGINPVNGKILFDLYQCTWDKIQYIKDQGYNVVEMWECQWLASIKRDPELSRFIKSRKRPCDGLVTMTEDQILTAVIDEIAYW